MTILQTTRFMSYEEINSMCSYQNINYVNTLFGKIPSLSMLRQVVYIVSTVF
jgi:hypothetical protein